MKLAKENRLKTIAFPNISTGVYRFPKELAAEIAISTVSDFLNQDDWFEEVTFCVYDDENYEIYDRIIDQKD